MVDAQAASTYKHHLTPTQQVLVELEWKQQSHGFSSKLFPTVCSISIAIRNKSPSITSINYLEYISIPVPPDPFRWIATSPKNKHVPVVPGFSKPGRYVGILPRKCGTLAIPHDCRKGAWDLRSSAVSSKKVRVSGKVGGIFSFFLYTNRIPHSNSSRKSGGLTAL